MPGFSDKMDSDEPGISVGHKRPRSTTPSPPDSSFISTSVPTDAETPPSKRLRRSLIEPSTIDETAHPALASKNPLNRRTLKKDAKRAKKAARKAHAGARRNGEGGMEVDEEASSLAFTFLASPEGVVA